ncbi:MAG: iron-sulfur cluster assembly protein, partial [Candidatus Thorarchaeota archaeon]
TRDSRNNSHRLLRPLPDGFQGIDVTTVEEVFEALKPVKDPEIPVSITDPRVGIVKQEYIRVDDGLITVLFKPTAPYCPMGGLIGILIRHRLEELYPDYTIRVRVVPGTHSQEQAVNEMISNNERYRSIVEQMKQRGMM